MPGKYGLLVENLPLAFAEYQIVINNRDDFPDLIFFAVNTAFTQLTGQPRADVIGKKIAEIFPGIEVPILQQLTVPVTQEPAGEAVRFEYYAPFLGGPLKVIAYHSAPGRMAMFFRAPAKEAYQQTEKAQQEIAEANRRMLKILDASASYVYVVDLQTHEILFTNRYGKKHFGDIVGTKCWQMIDKGESGPCAACLNGRLLDAAGRPTGVHDDKYKNTRNGRWYKRRELAMRWIDGRMVKLGIATDITEYRQLQKKYSQVQDLLNAHLEGLLDSASIWINTLDVEGNVTYWNKAAAQISGYRAAEVVGHARVWDWLYPDSEYRKQISAIRRAIIFKGKKLDHYETQIQCKDGRQRSMLCHLQGIVEDGRIVGSVALAIEITARKQVVSALRVSEERYRTLVNNANEAIIVVQDGQVVFANPATEQILGRPVQEITNMYLQDFVHPDDRERILKKHEKLLREEQVQNPHPAKLIAADGGVRKLSNSSVFIQWEGRPAVLCLITDVTEMEKMQAEIMKADKLEALGLLAGGIAHDFNNYLATLAGNVSLAKIYKNDYHKIHEKLGNMEKAIHQLKDLSNQLFTFAQGGGPVKEVVSLQGLIEDNVKFTLSGTNVRCKFMLQADLQRAAVDEGQFCQVLNNIVINAMQAMPGGGTLAVTAENTELRPVNKNYSHLPLKAGPYVKISIQDQGPGIKKEDLLKIFDPFFTTKERGSGLGLATSYSIIKKHGGYLDVESQKGAGTTFHIYLPASRQGGKSTARKRETVYGLGKILLMDDEPEILKLTAEMLTYLGYEVALARDGREVLSQYRAALKSNRPFDLVIMDLTIPGRMGGREAIAELLQEDPAVKALVCSGYSADPVMNNYRAHGFKGAIRKPFTIEELSRLVSKSMKDD